MTARPHFPGMPRRPRTRHGRRRTPFVVAFAVAAALLALAGLAWIPGPARAVRAGAPAPAPASTPSSARTAGAEARLVDRVPTPVLRWTACRKTDACATARLPLDYGKPLGATIDVALLRVGAKDPAHRLGTLFVNPGGPGDSARDFAALLPQGVSQAILDRFDIVGVDPRGVGGSRQIRCFGTTARQARALGPLTSAPFPVTAAEQRSWVGAAETFGRACATTGRQVASAMSTTQDARDMDVLRRAVGDSKLTYLGESFGSYLGQVYANMFPDRVRAIALDGIVDPQAIAGTAARADQPVFDRMGSAAAGYRALHELLDRCGRAGPSVCSFADADPQARFGRLADRLRAHPLRLAAPGVTTTTYTYASLVRDTEQWLHDPDGYVGLFADLTDLARLTAPGGAGADHAAVVRRFLARHPAAQPAAGYDNRLEAFSGKVCADGPHAARAASWPAAAAAADRDAPYFGAYYAWLSVQCAGSTWPAQDEAVYRGPFDRRTAAPVLVIGDLWDPVTSYDSAVKVAGLLPNSRLVSSDSWGHEALGTSACVDDTAFGYLLRPLARAPKVTHCRGDVQPFGPAPSTT
ncbi:alpha/beta hydrolase [Streptomyces sp. NBC_00669]|uniref:alpha/beta hydrolase n=1 Tax=Streptomyces sp. NBC_00669 TaxID=2976011 RepID=UPI002E343CC5|nr:alpha/beta hydrolase [Streptomyces sp. NBC_00669]